jgi:tRNA pseudouridine55 synthase
LGVGAHLQALRRTRVGRFGVDQAHRLEELERTMHLLPLPDAVAASFPRVDVTAEQAGRIGHGQRLALGLSTSGPTGVFAPDGSVVALVADRDGVAQPLCVFA